MTTHQSSEELKGFVLEIMETEKEFAVILKGPNGFATTLKKFDGLCAANKFMALVLSF